MSKGRKIKGKWFWLACAACGWRGQSDKRLRTCPRCQGQKTLKRESQVKVAAEVSVEIPKD